MSPQSNTVQLQAQPNIVGRYYGDYNSPTSCESKTCDGRAGNHAVKADRNLRRRALQYRLYTSQGIAQLLLSNRCDQPFRHKSQ